MNQIISFAKLDCFKTIKTINYFFNTIVNPIQLPKIESDYILLSKNH